MTVPALLTAGAADPMPAWLETANPKNHGFYRHYDLAKRGRVWTLSGKSERATIRFSKDRRTQTIVWEWKPGSRWLPLCDRVAVRTR